MLKNIFLASAVALCAVGAQAQETLYLVKDNNVVAKYRVSDVDYATFHLPEGVTDNTPDLPVVQETHFLSAVGSYYGTMDGVADFQVQLSTRDLSDENTPVEFLYLQFSTPAADYKNLSLAEGTYTLGDAEEPSAFTFYAGQREIGPDGEMVGGTMLLSRPDNATNIATLVTDGSFEISKDGNTYTIKGLLRLEGNKMIQFTYTGICHIDNYSSEKDPAEFLPNPPSCLTENLSFESSDLSYVTSTVFDTLFDDMPQYRYVWLMLYTDDTYANCLDLGLLVDKTKGNNGSVLLPKGKYPVVSISDPALKSHETLALPLIRIQGETNIAQYGCVYTSDYSNISPLVAGEVEVLEDSADLKNLNIKVTLYDNAETPHSISASYNGRVE